MKKIAIVYDFDKTIYENMSKNGAFDVTNYIAPIDDKRGWLIWENLN